MAQSTRVMPVHRLEAFSDGVIAIVITLMILGIKIPEINDNDSTRAIWTQWINLLPSLVAYTMSFITLGVLWVNHHQFFLQLKQLDRKLLWYNLHLLFWMCIIPIPTAFLGLHFQKPEATALYGFNMFMTALAFALMRLYVNKNEHLLIENLSLALRKKTLIKLLTSVALYFVSIFAGYISIYIAIGIFVVILSIFFLPQKIIIENN